ncbi:copper resistance protein NlpE [Gemmobacter serpentinus]|uniref:copper resistance protein NlpE n=1 Tax=Gemmobacter serpentinus TaxID=2652247 RepID=UPI00124EE012|nr:copper resistance protein NlpE [Gemmobacter serpentinus]
MRALVLLPFALVLAACQPDGVRLPDPTGDTSQNALDWAGRYEGLLPCADCAGIRSVLDLTEDGHFTLSETYEGKGGTAFVTKGRFTWDAAGSVITLGKGSDLRRFKVGEGRIWHLDQQGRVIDGALAENYILTKSR